MIRSPVPGSVVRRCRLGGQRVDGAGKSQKGGNYAVVVDRMRNIHYFAHMQELPTVVPGQEVVPGQKIGLLGETGESPGGPHLHYQVWGRFPHAEARDEYEKLEFVYAFTGPINPFVDLTCLAALMGGRPNRGGRWFIPPLSQRVDAPWVRT